MVVILWAFGVTFLITMIVVAYLEEWVYVMRPLGAIMITLVIYLIYIKKHRFGIAPFPIIAFLSVSGILFLIYKIKSEFISFMIGFVVVLIILFGIEFI